MTDNTENIGTAENEKKQSLEEMFAQLEGVIAEMEEDGISLEHSFELYDKGMGLLKECSRSIDEVEKKVLILDEDGETHEF
ncbi:MAG TPA: exodeoxyribonuclease VII small subunit [Candidatus Mediterraneibacter intestinipullorum]|nr:exodeoxyribonuclease VII small subunit [Candidatus Mediterraneibacter intestinipullorum]